MIVGILCNLEILFYFKYLTFLTGSIVSLMGNEPDYMIKIALPIGVSFFTFQAMSYIIDVYRGETEASENPINVALYISFFPQLIAGPIVKYRDINIQIEERKVIWSDASDGFKRFIYGLGKKILIANVMGLCTDTIYSCGITSMDSKAAWIGAVAYTFQIYYDFSGYSDMAIGLAKMFGFTIKENFNYPYLSRSISEFWRRWHISLGSWFKEYVYIPLGGNRKGTGKTYINLIIVFFLTGLWHGADWSFVIWGLYHCLFAIIERAGLKKVLDKTRIISFIYTFFVVNLGWVFFRASDMSTAVVYITRMFQPWKYKNMLWIWDYLDNKTVFIFVCAVLGMGILRAVIPQKIKDWWNGSVPEALYCVLVLLLSLALIAGDTYNPFIYFQF